MDELEDIRKRLEEQDKLVANLIEYLERTDPNFKLDPATFINWADRLQDMRRDDMIQKKIKEARAMLEQHGYIVAKDESELDAQKLKHWINKGDKPMT